MGFVAKTMQKEGEEGVARGRNSIICGNCGRTGHEKEFWQIIGFPEWFTERIRRMEEVEEVGDEKE